MKNAKRKFRVLLAGFLTFSCIVVWAWLLDQMNNWFSVRWLEYQVKRDVDPIELQQWATNLLAYHKGIFYQDFYGTNIPLGLRKVKAGYPNVEIFESDQVWVFGDSKGSPFLVVGAPFLAAPTNENIIPWKPGIYFVR